MITGGCGKQVEIYFSSVWCVGFFLSVRYFDFVGFGAVSLFCLGIIDGFSVSTLFMHWIPWRSDRRTDKSYKEFIKLAM